MPDQDEIADLRNRLARAERRLDESVRAEGVLREAEARHRLLIGSWAQAEWESDAGGVIIADSPSWRAYTGQTVAEWLGNGWLDAIHPDDRPHAERQWREAIAARGLMDAEFRLRAPGGGWRWTNVRAAPVLDPDGRIEKWAGLNIDIDARRQAEAALSESEAQYRLLYDSIDDGFCVIEMLFDPAGRPFDYRFLKVNPAFRRQTGLLDVVGRTIVSMLPDQEPFWIETYGRIARSGRSERFDHRADAMGRWYEVDATPVGEPGRNQVAVTFRDVLQRRRADEAVRESEARYRTLLDTIDEGFCVIEVLFDAEGRPDDYRFLELNPVFEKQAGFTIAPGQRIREIAPDHEQFWFDIYGRVVLTGEPERFEHGAEAFGVFYDVYAYRVDAPALCRVAVLFRDITERKRAQEQLRASDERQAFLLRLSDALRPLTDPLAEQVEAMKLLVAHLNLVRAACYGIDDDQDGMELVASVETDAVTWPRRMLMSDFGADISATYRSGQTYQVGDAATDPRLTAGGREAIRDLGIRRLAGVPLVKAGRLVAVLGVHAREPRDWREDELRLLAEVAERLWASVGRARAEAAVRESEERFQQFAKASAAGLWIRDARTLDMEFVSPAISAIYGTAPDALLGDVARWDELIVPECRAVARRHLEEARQGDTVVHEFRIRRPSDQTIRWIRNTDFPIRDGEHIQRIGGIAEDITDAKLIQQELEHSDERLRSAVEVGRVGLWDWNVITNQTHWSDQHFRMQGYAVGEVEPSYETWATRLHSEDREATEATLHRAMAEHREYVREFRTVYPDGAVHWHSGRGRFFYNDHGEPIRMIGAIVDTTERREWEERQKVLVGELQHRTRNLMGVVRSMSEKTARASADLADFRARFHTRLEALSRVQGLLSRMEDHDRVTFDDLIRTELSVMDGTADRVTFSGPDGIRLRSSTVQTLAMALHELTTNAMKYGALGQPAGRLAITWLLDPDGEGDEPWLEIDWRESGVAMPPPGAAPQGTGQGRELIERALPYQLKARTSYRLGPDGVHCTIAIPVSASSGEAEDQG